jgi:transcriptional regulator with XRE-family HTH domain
MPRGPKSAHHAALGAAIRELRVPKNGGPEAGLSQEGLAAKAGLHRNYIGAVERGEINISFENLRLIARALGVELSELMRRYEDGSSPRSR